MNTQSETKTYNGWTNYETWNVALWMDNEQGSYDEARLDAKRFYDEAEAEKPFTKEERAALNYADYLKDQFEDGMPDVTGPYADLLGAAMSEVNWYEIAKHLVDEIVSESKP